VQLCFYSPIRFHDVLLKHGVNFVSSSVKLGQSSSSVRITSLLPEIRNDFNKTDVILLCVH
jgi:hypothetical protein